MIFVWLLFLVPFENQQLFILFVFLSMPPQGHFLLISQASDCRFSLFLGVSVCFGWCLVSFSSSCSISGYLSSFGVSQALVWVLSYCLCLVQRGCIGATHNYKHMHSTVTEKCSHSNKSVKISALDCGETKRRDIFSLWTSKNSPHDDSWHIFMCFAVFE